MMVNIEFSEQELANLAQIMDAGVRSLGLNSVIAAAEIKTKIEAAVCCATQEDSQGCEQLQISGTLIKCSQM